MSKKRLPGLTPGLRFVVPGQWWCKVVRFPSPASRSFACLLCLDCMLCTVS